MATDVERLIVRVEATQRKFERQLASMNKAAKRSANRIERQFIKSNRRAGRSFDRLGASSRNALSGRFLKGAGLVAAIALVGSAALAAAKRGQKLIVIEARLDAITGSSKRAQASLDAIIQVADLTGVGIDAVAGAFSRYTLAAQEIGATTGEVEILTKTIMELGAIGGGTQQELSAGAQQLAQSLAKGVLNGDELRSVMENMPLVAKQIAEGLGVSVGRLKDMGAAGELTSKKVFDALLKGADAADARFEKLPMTVERASARMANAFDVFLSKINEATGASRMLAAVYESIANSMNSFTQDHTHDVLDSKRQTVAEIDRKTIEAQNIRVKISKKAAAPFASDIRHSRKANLPVVLEYKIKARDAAIAKATEQIDRKIAELFNRRKNNVAQINDLEGRIQDKKNQQYDSEKAKGIFLGKEKAGKATIAALQKIEDARALAALDKRTQAGKKARAEAEAALKATSGFVSKKQLASVGNAAESAALAAFDNSHKPKKKTGGGSPARELVGFFSNLDAQKQSMQEQIALIGLSDGAIVRLTTKQRLLDKAKKEGIALDVRSAETGRTVREEIDLQAESVGQLSDEYRASKISEDRFVTGVEGVSDAFAGAIVAGESLKDNLRNVFQGIARDILSSGIRDAILGQFENGHRTGGIFATVFNGFFGGKKAGSVVASANGNVFDGGAVTAFATGGIVNSPTLFPMSGGAGLMGEAGPEAIMPLTRGPGGKLGVRASGGATTVRISLSPGLEAQILDRAQGQSVEVTKTALDMFNRHMLPLRVNQIAKNPKVIG